MKYKKAIIYGIMNWLLITIITSAVYPHTINLDSASLVTLIIPISILLITSFFTVLYIRNFDTNEILEGLKLGLIFVVIDILGDCLIYLLNINNNLIVESYQIHLISTIILTIAITTFIGYLAQMTIELR